jgi:hypothetical protein
MRKNQMVDFEDLLISQMISFVDELMLLADPEISQFNEDDRMNAILLFFCHADLIRSPTAGQSDDRWAITENAFYATGRDISCERDYRSMAWPAVMRTALKGRTHGRTDQCCIREKKFLPTRSRPHTGYSDRFNLLGNCTFLASWLAGKLSPEAKPASLAAPAEIFGVPLSKGINPAHFLDKSLQRRSGPLAMSGVPKRSRPFADRFIVNATLRCAANNGGEWVRVLVEYETSELKCPSQKPFCPSLPFVVHD